MLDTGSSPLARGARTRGRHVVAVPRIIPARAGSTRARSSSPCLRWDHPRSRGEHLRWPDGDRSPSGSSPLARGALEPVQDRVHRMRIIPARAGSTLARSPTPSVTPDHPRSRGEHASRRFGNRVASGSSPLARGAPLEAVECGGEFRIIPARAGSTRCSRSHRSCHPDHPRSRGEHAGAVAKGFATAGSSPLARGAHERVPPANQALGIIPARAGSTC